MIELRPPTSTDTSLKRGEVGWAVYALQACLNAIVGADLVCDGHFGGLTESRVVEFQREIGLLADGIAGPTTQGRMIRELTDTTHVAGAPGGLARGMNEGEGGPYLGSVNWAIVGGVDCGIVQERVFGPPFGRDELEHAFHPRRALARALQRVVSRADGYEVEPWARFSRERQLRCAIMAHNWPAGALSIARTGRCSSPDAIATWVPLGVKFPDGASVRTRWEWCQFYAMGGAHGPARIPRYVNLWPT